MDKIVTNNDLEYFENTFLFHDVSNVRFGNNISTNTINIRAYMNDYDYIQFRTSDISMVLETVVNESTKIIWTK